MRSAWVKRFLFKIYAKIKQTQWKQRKHIETDSDFQFCTAQTFSRASHTQFGWYDSPNRIGASIEHWVIRTIMQFCENVNKKKITNNRIHIEMDDNRFDLIDVSFKWIPKIAVLLSDREQTFHSIWTKRADIQNSCRQSVKNSKMNPIYSSGRSCATLEQSQLPIQ